MHRLVETLKKTRIFRSRNDDIVHFLHIGKCAGTAIKDLATQINAIPHGPRIIGHGHSKKLADLPCDSKYFFSIRDPITRYYSAFYMRKSKEQPRLYREWSEGERNAYSTFTEANDLAESLFVDSDLGTKAFFAMQSIGHLKSQHTWFNLNEIINTRPPICIVRREKIDLDIAYLLKSLNIDDKLSLPADPVRSHRNNYDKSPPLSQKAKKNLEVWYSIDIEYYKKLDSWIDFRQRHVG